LRRLVTMLWVWALRRDARELAALHSGAAIVAWPLQAACCGRALLELSRLRMCAARCGAAKRRQPQQRAATGLFRPPNRAQPGGARLNAAR